MIVQSSAPTRIDLGGGTLDLWPLHLWFNNPPTLNASIDLYASVEVKTRRDRTIVVTSRDLKTEARFASIDHLPEKHPLELILRLLKFYRPTKGVEVITDCQAPAGSGIGGSSALNIALNGAFNKLTGSRFKKTDLIEIAKNIETQVIDVPAGTQDYYSALNGGVQAIYPGYDKVRTESKNIDPATMTKRFVLCFTGKPRASGINNWDVFQRVVNGDNNVKRNLGRIAEVSTAMDRALSGRPNWEEFGKLFWEEWKARRNLAPNISTPHMDRLIAESKKAGALSAKVCGAGGGGCVAFFVPPKLKDAVSEAVTRQGGQLLDFQFVKRGLKVRTL